MLLKYEPKHSIIPVRTKRDMFLSGTSRFMSSDCAERFHGILPRRKQFSFLGHCCLQTNSQDTDFKCHKYAKIVLLEQQRYRNLLVPAVTSSSSHCADARKCAKNSKSLSPCIRRLRKDVEITGILLFM